MPVSVGLQHAGSFQVSGWPYINAATLNSSEQEFAFNFISSEVTVWNVGSQSLDFYFTTGDTSPFKLPAGKKVTMSVKTGSIFAKSASGTDIKLFVSMTNIPVGLIGTIPTGSYFGPIPDDDGDGVPDWSDAMPLFYGVPPAEASQWEKTGTEDLWMEISGSSQGLAMDSHTYYLGEFISSDYPLLYPGLEAFYLNVDGDMIDYTANIESPTQASWDAIDTNVAGTYTVQYKVSKENSSNPGQNLSIIINRQIIVLGIEQPAQTQTTFSMEPESLATSLDFEGPTGLDEIDLELDLEVNEYEEDE